MSVFRSYSAGLEGKKTRVDVLQSLLFNNWMFFRVAFCYRPEGFP